jgi:hypothetical protein
MKQKIQDKEVDIKKKSKLVFLEQLFENIVYKHDATDFINQSFIDDVNNLYLAVIIFINT